MAKRLKDNELIEVLAVKHDVDKRVSKFVAHYPLKYTKRKIEDKDNWRPIRIRYFGIFGLKKEARDKYWNNDSNDKSRKKVSKKDERKTE